MSEILHRSYTEQLAALARRRDEFDEMIDGRMSQREMGMTDAERELREKIDTDIKELEGKLQGIDKHRADIEETGKPVTQLQEPACVWSKARRMPDKTFIRQCDTCAAEMSEEEYMGYGGHAIPCKRLRMVGSAEIVQYHCAMCGAMASKKAFEHTEHCIPCRKTMKKATDTLSIGNEPPKYLTAVDLDNDSAIRPDLLETFPAPPVSFVDIKNTRDEFTCLCPATGQPDFGSIEVRYTPKNKCLESRSWKLYLVTYRNARLFHEQIVCRIYEDLWNAIDPLFLRVVGRFTPRGGITFTPTREGASRDAK